MFCPKCGVENEKNSNFCKNCSLPLSDARESLNKTQEATSNKPAVQLQNSPIFNTAKELTYVKSTKNGMNPFLIALIVLVGLVVVFFIYVVLSPDATDTTIINTNDYANINQTDPKVNKPDPEVNKPEPQKTIDLVEIVNLDVFDWQVKTDAEKEAIAFAIQFYWNAGGVKGKAIDIKSSELAKKISERMGNQTIVFEEACRIYNIDPQPFIDLAGK